MTKLIRVGFHTVILLAAICMPLFAGQDIIAARVNQAPVVDGAAEDPAWTRCQDYVTHDRVGGIDVTLRAAYTDSHIFFLVQFPDPDESLRHKYWVWNHDLKLYETGPEREDTFIFKWSMTGNQADLGLRSETGYTADIWFWKANRTDPVGKADDKIQTLGVVQKPKTQPLTNQSGRSTYLSRRGDRGRSAYQPVIHVDYQGDRIPQFENRPPSGSRADVQARGVWKAGVWTIEFSRNLVTGHADDLQLDPTETFLFGVSRYEIAGRKEDPALSQPKYGSGDVSEPLMLVFGN